jgi:hypothetical protein
VFAEHFSNLYECSGTLDEEVLRMLPQRAVRHDLGELPTDGEIEDATNGLNQSSPGPSGVPAAVWQCLLESKDAFSLLKQMVMSF